MNFQALQGAEFSHFMKIGTDLYGFWNKFLILLVPRKGNSK